MEEPLPDTTQLGDPLSNITNLQDTTYGWSPPTTPKYTTRLEVPNLNNNILHQDNLEVSNLEFDNLHQDLHEPPKLIIPILIYTTWRTIVQWQRPSWLDLATQSLTTPKYTPCLEYTWDGSPTRVTSTILRWWIWSLSFHGLKVERLWL